MDKNIAISVKNISKTFKIPHEKVSSVRGAVTNIFKSNSYEEFKALDDVSFEVKKGEFFGIIGRNGSGKSTLLKILAGIYQADKGKVNVNGMISPFLELGIGFNPELSGRDNVYLNATVLGMTKKQIDEKFDSIVKFSELERFIDQKLKNYSSGMQVRLAFSVSIHANREILLMDEVLAVGDSNFQSKCLEEFNKYREMGKTVIIVTHDIAVVQRYCDRALLIRNGKLIKIGKAEEVVMEYVSENIFDEEEIILHGEYLDNENNNSEIKKSKSVVNLINASLKDKDNCEKFIFQTGEEINIDVKYDLKKEFDNPIFGLIVNSADKQSIFVTNTEFVDKYTGKNRVGEISIRFNFTNYLADGLFFCTLAVADKNARVYFWKDNLIKFKVRNKNYKSTGIVDFPHKILIK